MAIMRNVSTNFYGRNEGADGIMFFETTRGGMTQMDAITFDVPTPEEMAAYKAEMAAYWAREAEAYEDYYECSHGHSYCGRH